MVLRVLYILRYIFFWLSAAKLLRTETNQHVKDKAANGLASKILSEFLNYRWSFPLRDLKGWALFLDSFLDATLLIFNFYEIVYRVIFRDIFIL